MQICTTLMMVGFLEVAFIIKEGGSLIAVGTYF